MRSDFSVVVIPTFACNSACSHCFEKISPQSIKREAWPEYFRRIKELAEYKKVSRLLLYWQGGEVMAMGARAINEGLEICAETFSDNGIVIEHHLQTNLLLYDENWRDIIRRYFRSNISSSLDYPNLYRITAGLDTKGYVDAWFEKKKQAEVDGFIVNIITLPNVATLDLGAAEFYTYFRDRVGVSNVQINFPFPGVDGDKPEPLMLDKFADFMEELYHIWIDSDRCLNLNPFAALENRLYGNTGRLPCCWSYNCADYLVAIAPDGEVGQCDCWVSTQKDYSFGMLGQQPAGEIFESQGRELFLDRPGKMIDNPECGQCPYWMICFGGCPIRALTFTGDIYSKDYYCSVYKKIFAAVVEYGQRGDGKNG